MIQVSAFRFVFLVVTFAILALGGTSAHGEAEIKLDQDFLVGVIEKLPPAPFQKEGQYRGSVSSYRLLAIDPKTRRFLLECEVAGAFRSLLAKAASRPGAPAPGASDTEEWHNFRFELRAGVHVEPAGDGTPRFRVDIEEVKHHELEGVAGALAAVMGKSFDAIAKEIVERRVSRLNEKLNAEMVKRIKAFQDYGVFYAIDYAPTSVTLKFGASTFATEGIAGYVFPEPRNGTVPLYRWSHVRRPIHVYSINPANPDGRVFRNDEITGYVFSHPQPGTVPLRRWRRGPDFFYTTALDSEGAPRRGYRPEGVACHLFATAQPGTVPLYRFVEPHTGLHFYSTNAHAEFGK